MISFLASSVLTLAAVVTSPSLPPVSDVLSGMAKQTTGLQAYEVPVTIHASIRNGILAVPLSVTGERYFAAPDKEALKLNDVPALAKVFSNLYASLGTPLTWPQTYDLQVVNPDHASTSPIYELRGTYKHTSSVDHILLDVDAETYEPVQVRWFYRNGSTIAMNVQEKAVGAFRLPSVEDVDVHFPGYSGHATIEYGAYAVNGTLPASAFGSQ